MMPAPIICATRACDFTAWVAPEHRITTAPSSTQISRCAGTAVDARHFYGAGATRCDSSPTTSNSVTRAVLHRSRGIRPSLHHRDPRPGARDRGGDVWRAGRGRGRCLHRPHNRPVEASRTFEAMTQARILGQLRPGHGADGRLGPLPRKLVGRDGLQLADGHQGVELLPRLPARPRRHSRHRAAGGPGGRAQPGPAPEPDRLQLRLATLSRGPGATA